MIDWDLTKAKFGDVDLSQFRPRVIVRCDKCNKESIFTIRVKSRLKNSQLSWLCYKCACNKGDVKKTHSKQMSAQWENQIYYNERSNSSKELWRGDDFKKCHHEAVQEQDSRQKCSDAARLAWQNPDYREKHAVALAKQLIRTPNTEKRVRQILTDLGVQFDTNVVVGPYTFDIGVKRENKPYLLLEVNGNYWHTRPYVMRKDAAKADYISKFQQYELKTVWEHQLFDIIKVKQLLSRFVGNEIPQFVRLDLSQINYSTITDRKQLNEFFGNYHYLGSAGRCGMAVGGFYNEQLICAAIFAHPTRKESYINICSSKEVYELTRFLIHPSYHIPNLASHFLSRSINFIPRHITHLISYSDPSAGHDGTIYLAANWSFVGETKPSYFYMNDEGWIMHKKTLYNRAKSLHLKEAEFAIQYGYKKVHTPPLKKFIKNR